MIKLTIQRPLKLALVSLTGTRVSKTPGAFEQLKDLAASYRRQHGERPISEFPGVQEARRLFRALGIEPTNHRPSSEALLRRALKDKGFHQVNSAVDVINWCSLDFLLPICAYDLAKIEGDVVLREGRPGESYPGLNRREVNLEGRYALVDQKGPFGSPMTDSQRTAISIDSTALLAIILAPLDFEDSRLAAFGHTLAGRLIDAGGGSSEERVAKSE